MIGVRSQRRRFGHVEKAWSAQAGLMPATLSAVARVPTTRHL